MTLRGKRIFTGRMQLLDGWELRPFAIQEDDGSFAPRLAARQHRAGGGAERVFALDLCCQNKEEAFELALARGRGLISQELTPAA